MSWRSSRRSRSVPSSSPAPRAGGGIPVLDPFLRALILAALLIGVVGLGLILTRPRTNQQSSAAAPTAAPAPTVAAEPTAAQAALVAAGSDEVTGNAEAGRALFSSMANGGVACNICHLVEPGSGVLVGPSLSGAATRAASRVPGQSAVQYLRASITAPNDHVVEGFTSGIMIQTYGQTLTPAQVDDLVAYLLTLQ